MPRRAERNGAQHPGAADWHIPPAELPRVFAGRSPAEICRLIKDPAQNGGLSLDQVVHHVRNDPLVRWAFAPGPGRTPASPFGWEILASFVERWRDYGAACPPVKRSTSYEQRVTGYQ